jgi:hypothetical protein
MKYFETPLFTKTKLSKDQAFVVSIDFDICMDCNAVYASKWETTRREDYDEKKTEAKGILNK